MYPPPPIPIFDESGLHVAIFSDLAVKGCPRKDNTHVQYSTCQELQGHLVKKIILKKHRSRTTYDHSLEYVTYNTLSVSRSGPGAHKFYN